MWVEPEPPYSEIIEVCKMGLYTYIRKTFIEEYKERSPEYKKRLMEWRREPTIVMVDKPTNIARARYLGYKAKEGYYIVRVKTRKGRRTRKKPRGGRKPKRNIKYIAPEKSYQAIAEEKAARKYRGLEVLNSYWVGEDGTHKYFEVIMIDPDNKSVTTPAKNRRGRAFRGLTSAGRKHRGLRHKGKVAKKPVR